MKIYGKLQLKSCIRSIENRTMSPIIVSCVLLLISISGCFAGNNCWWTGCQPNTWAQRGCTEGFYQINTQSCSNGDKYQCCPNGGQTSGSSTQGQTSSSAQGQTSSSGRVAQSGKCSWYGAIGEIPPGWPTASGEPFDRLAMKAAHIKLPFGTRIRVKNFNNGKTVDVAINDRGPFCPAGVSCPPFEIKIVDLTYGAFQKVADTGTGVIPCSYEIL